jgi:hypothetical protein
MANSGGSCADTNYSASRVRKPRRIRALSRLAQLTKQIDLFETALDGEAMTDVCRDFGISRVACVVVGLFATETKGRVLEEISP